MKISEILTESFDQPYPFQLKKDGKMTYSSTVKLPDKTTLYVHFDGMEREEAAYLDDPDEIEWDIVFTRTALGRREEIPGRVGSTDQTGQGDQMRVLSTVMAVIKEFIKKTNPKYMQFSASKDKKLAAGEDKTAMQSREKLYARMVKKYLSKDFKVTQGTYPAGTVWNLERKK